MPRRSGIDAVKGIMRDRPGRVRGDVQRARPGDAGAGGAAGRRARLHREAVQAGRGDRDARRRCSRSRSSAWISRSIARSSSRRRRSTSPRSAARCSSSRRTPPAREAIDIVFRMAHSIKGMAASLDYTAIAELAHRLEDRMQAIRERGSRAPARRARRCCSAASTALEAMVEAVKRATAPRRRPIPRCWRRCARRASLRREARGEPRRAALAPSGARRASTAPPRRARRRRARRADRPRQHARRSTASCPRSAR